MQIQDKEYDSIVITSGGNEVLVVISDTEIVELKGYKVQLVPRDD